MTKNNNKGSAKKKLLPAAAMLTTSAVMLSTATYAWFTMSREVEVKGISMTATTPEDIQISLGHLTGPTGGYSDNTGLLGSADNGAASAPAAGNDDKSMLDWSNSIEITEYYRLGRIIPASSTNGVNIWFTPNATGVGKTVDKSATYYSAVNATTTNAEATVRTGSTKPSLATTLHAITDDTAASDVWNTGASGDTYKVSNGWNSTNDDGYYVDIPVWLRTSSTDGVKLSVDAYVTPKTYVITGNDDADNVLYKAARVAIIPDDTTSASAETAANKLVNLKNGFDESGKTALSDGYSGPTTNMVDFYGRNKTTGAEDGTAQGTFDAANGESLANYDKAVIADTNACVVDLTGTNNKGSGTGYGTAKKYYIRVWLEGEDPECWNANAGQDFTISLKFSKIDSTASTP